ncbi:fumarate reductase (CoM/CoB) subunit TfrA [Methanobacterium formicicum]|uniref:Succinate dehydrogenase flavoprotein subunit n=1 Tax=Methanobacterium formicicum (strain DSM 3637 / PP1) TaxID=1204725 RepID=K2QG03_METFP|nr:fumarate reductase (CoM/CoB) subunit TfrA [Methanobacterium formicicum]EKF87006.1 succinate dehydrogenase flavoprotein subunit [Methanobacterium formicicum DSM 3637]
MERETYQADVLVIGSGGAGSRAAIEAKKHGLDVIIVSKGLSFKSGCTTLAEGGYNAAFAYVDVDDSTQAHLEDTLKGGGYLNDPELARILVEEAPERLTELESYGALFDRQESGKLNQRPFGGQTYRRTCFQGDRTGHEMMTALKEEIIRQDIQTVDEVMITTLLKDSEGRIGGACGISLSDTKFMVFLAKSTIVTTGGAGWIYPVTSNVLQKTGDGYAMAWKAGADLLDMEQVQFHPTGMLYPDSRRGVLVTEAVRGEGGRLINSQGERFMANYDLRGELATRDVVARAIYNEIMEGRGTPSGGVYLDVTHLPPEVIEEKLETMLLQFQDVGVDIRKEPMEVAPTAHHFMGGARINPQCETSIPNLYVAGEAAGGVHGANRLGGNALAETQVFGRRAGESAAKNVFKSNFELESASLDREEERIGKLFQDGDYPPFQLKKELQEVMWNNVAIIRREKRLKSALKEIAAIKDKMERMIVPDGSGYNQHLLDALELENMVLIAELVTKSALIREESRGAHYRADYPDTKDEWKKSIVLNKDKRMGYVQR